jgi:hypothetical protein
MKDPIFPLEECCKSVSPHFNIVRVVKFWNFACRNFTLAQFYVSFFHSKAHKYFKTEPDMIL